MQMEVANAVSGRKINEIPGTDCPICLGLPSSPDEWRFHYQEKGLSRLFGVRPGVWVFRTTPALAGIRRDERRGTPRLYGGAIED